MSDEADRDIGSCVNKFVSEEVIPGNMKFVGFFVCLKCSKFDMYAMTPSKNTMGGEVEIAEKGEWVCGECMEGKDNV